MSDEDQAIDTTEVEEEQKRLHRKRSEVDYRKLSGRRGRKTNPEDEKGKTATASLTGEEGQEHVKVVHDNSGDGKVKESVEELTPRLAKISITDEEVGDKMAEKMAAEGKDDKRGEDVEKMLTQYTEQELDDQLAAEMAELERLEARERMAAKAKQLMDVKSKIAHKKSEKMTGWDNTLSERQSKLELQQLLLDKMREEERIYKREQEQQEEMARLREVQREQRRQREQEEFEQEGRDIKALLDNMLDTQLAHMDAEMARILRQETREEQTGSFMEDLAKMREVRQEQRRREELIQSVASGGAATPIVESMDTGARPKVAKTHTVAPEQPAQPEKESHPFAKPPPDTWAELQRRVQGAKPPVMDELKQVQMRAQELMKTRQNHLNAVMRKAEEKGLITDAAAAGATPQAAMGAAAAAAPPPSTAPLGGIHHLRQLNMATDSLMTGAGVEPRTVADVYAGKALPHTLTGSLKRPLDINTNFSLKIPDNGTKMVGKTDELGLISNVASQNASSSKIKSGKFAKSHTDLVRQELWPHTAVSKKYMKRTSFDTLDFEGFVAGETKIVYNMIMRGDHLRGLGRLRVLILIAHWLCRSKNWLAVRCLFESIIDEVEQGDADWTEDFSGHETILPNLQGTVERTKQDEKKKSSGVELYWCKQYQNGSCDKESPHMSQIRPDEPLVPVIHICAACWNTGKKKREHPENDPSCPSKK